MEDEEGKTAANQLCWSMVNRGASKREWVSVIAAAHPIQRGGVEIFFILIFVNCVQNCRCLGGEFERPRKPIQVERGMNGRVGIPKFAGDVAAGCGDQPQTQRVLQTRRIFCRRLLTLQQSGARRQFQIRRADAVKPLERVIETPRRFAKSNPKMECHAARCGLGRERF